MSAAASGRMTKSWDEMPESLKKDLIAKMPAEVRLRVKAGHKLTADELKTYADKYYDFNKVVVLWKVYNSDDTNRTVMRQMSQDLFRSLRGDLPAIAVKLKADLKTLREMDRLLPEHVDTMLLSGGVKAPPAFHWEVTYSDHVIED